MRTLVRAGIAGIALLLTGCAVPTRLMQMGPLSEREWLVTLVVSEDDRVVASECADVLAMGPILGCHLWHRVNVPGVGDVRIVKIVRYTDALPSTLAQEIDVHELCHAIAALHVHEDVLDVTAHALGDHQRAGTDHEHPAAPISLTDERHVAQEQDDLRQG